MALLPLALVAACRWDVGTDFYKIYYPSFQAMVLDKLGCPADLLDQIMEPLMERCRIDPMSGVATDCVRNYWLSYLDGVFRVQERGFTLIEEICFYCGFGFRGVVVATSAATAALLGLVLHRQTRHPAMALFFLVASGTYFLSLNFIRQYIAIGFALVSVEFIVRRRPLCFLACIVAGTIFHKSMLLIVPCYLFGYWAFRPVGALVVVASALAISPVIRPFVHFAPQYLPLGRFAGYFNPELWVPQGFQTIFFFINVAVLVLGAFCRGNACWKNPHFRVWYSMTVLGTVALAFSGVLPAMKRVNFYFSAPQFLLLPELLCSEVRPRLQRWMAIGVCAAFTLECVVAHWVFNKNEPLPYNVLRQAGDRMIRRQSKVPFGWQVPLRETDGAATNGNLNGGRR